MPKTTAQQEGTSLEAFVRKSRRKGCPVCALPPNIREQLKAAPAKKIKLEERVDWIKAVTGKSIPGVVIQTHVRGRHDYD